MTFRIPTNERRLSQPNSSDVNGNLYQTRNIDLNEDGYIKLAPATVSVFSEENASPFKNIKSISIGSVVSMVGNSVYESSKIDLLSSNISESTSASIPQNIDNGDAIYFNNKQIVSDDDVDDIKYDTAGTWTTITTFAAGSDPFAFSIFESQNSLLAGRGNVVKRINTSWAVAQTLTLPTEYIVTSIETIGSYAYIATQNRKGGDAKLFLWTGINTTNDGSYSVNAWSILSIKKYGSTVAAVDSTGRLSLFSGSGFTELASFPPKYRNIYWGDASDAYTFLRNRGMVVDGDLIYFIVTGKFFDVSNHYLDTLLGSVWCYNPKIGIYQIYSATNNSILVDSGVDIGDINTSTDTITTTVSVPSTGSVVYYEPLSSTIGGLLDGKWYFVIKVTSTTFKLAETYEDAINGNAINITSTSGSNRFYFISQKDYGAGIINDTTAIQVLNNDDIDNDVLSRIVFSAEVMTQTSAAIKHKLIAVCKNIKNLGYFVTPKMFASALADVFNSITLRFKPLKYGDKIIVKYRTEEKLGFPVLPNSRTSSDNLVTWTSTTVFTTPSSPSSNYYDFSNVAAGDEVEVINGSGSGFISKVSSISKSGFQYTVTLADANPFVTASDTSMVKIDNWKTIETIDGSTFTGTEKTIAVDATGGWIQFKIVLEGTGVTLFDNIIDNKAAERSR